MSKKVEKFLLTNRKKQSKIKKTNGGEKNKKYISTALVANRRNIRKRNNKNK